MPTEYLLPITVMLGLFAVSALVVGRSDGVRCIGLLIGAPALLLGMGWGIAGPGLPVLPAVLGTAALALVGQVFLLLGREGGRRWAALSACCGLLVAVALAGVAVLALKITGVFSSTTRDLWFASNRDPQLHYLALGGIVLAGVGVIADLAVAVAATVREVHAANPSLSARQLFRSGMRFGRDVICTELNTLPLAILGASMGGLLLLLVKPDVARWPYSWMLLTNSQETGVEAAALLAGTVAMVLTIPIAAICMARALGARTAGEAISPENPPSGGSQQDRLMKPSALLPLLLLGVGAISAFCWIGQSSYQYPERAGSGMRTQLVRGTATEVTPTLSPWAPRRGEPGAERPQEIVVTLTDGQNVRAENPVTGSPVNDRLPRPGDRVIARVQTSGSQTLATLGELERDRMLVVGLALACAVVVIVAGWQGWRAIAALAVSLLLVGLLLAAVVRWQAPPIVSTLVCMLTITGVAYLIICGWSRKALSAALGTLAGLTAAALTALLFSKWLSLSGQYNAALSSLPFYSGGRDLDFRGLLVAAALIGSLGVVMDVSIGVASAVGEVRRASPESGFARLFQSGMSVGRKIMAAMFGAILFAYLGLHLAMCVLPWAQAGTAGQVLGNERVVTEVFRLLVGGLALVWSIPATALASAWLEAGRGEDGNGQTDSQ